MTQGHSLIVCLSKRCQSSLLSNSRPRGRKAHNLAMPSAPWVFLKSGWQNRKWRGTLLHLGMRTKGAQCGQCPGHTSFWEGHMKSTHNTQWWCCFPVLSVSAFNNHTTSKFINHWKRRLASLVILNTTESMHMQLHLKELMFIKTLIKSDVYTGCLSEHD